MKLNKVVQDTEEEHEGVLPNESAPIDISMHNHLSDSNIVPEVCSDLNQHSTSVNCSDVPYSIDENILDKSKIKENNRLTTENNSCNIDSDKDSPKSSFDWNIVPNMVNATEERSIPETDSETLKDRFYFAEEPPDLHIVDDSKVEVEDFHYYDVYDEHEIEKQDQQEYDINEAFGDMLDRTSEEFEIPVDQSLEEIALNSLIDDSHKSTDANISSNNLKVEEIHNHFISDFEIQNSISGNFSYAEAILTNIDDYFNTDTVDNTKQLTVEIIEDHAPINATDETVIRCNEGFTESSYRCEPIDVLEQSVNNVIKDKGHSFDVEKKKIILGEEDSLEVKKDSFHLNTCEDKGIKTTYESDSKLDEPDNFCDLSKFIKNSDIDPSVVKFEDISNCNKFDDFAQFDDAKFSSSAIDHIEKADPELVVSSNCNRASSLSNVEDEEEDEFGDFGDYTQSDYRSTIPPQPVPATLAMKINKEEILKNVDRIVLEMYPTCNASYDDFVLVDVLETDQVFKSVKDVTDTNALMYQWIKSASQDKLLHALNIDTRNILYGPAWNPMMPKYAANLGLTPLEPVKSTDIASTSTQFGNSNPIDASSPATAQVDIPSAQFDWNGSGLINPLDCTQNNTMLLDLEHLVASLDLTHSSISTTQPPSPSDEFDEWEYWLRRTSKDNSRKTSDQEINLDQLEKGADTLTPVLRTRFHSDNESVKSLQLTTDTIQDSEEITNKPDLATTTCEHEFDEFTSYQSQKPTDYLQWSNTTLLLRETHISTERISEEPQQTPGTSKKVNEIDDEFTDFQMSLPDPFKVEKEQSKNKTISNEFGVFNTGSILQPVLEPLKPTIVSSNNNAQIATQINWPDPGITDDEILNIELSYSRKDVPSLEETKIQEGGVEVPHNIITQPIQECSNKPIHPCSFPVLKSANKHNSTGNTHADYQKLKENSNIMDSKQTKPSGVLSTTKKSIEPVPISNTSGRIQDEEDWSDFVCNPEPMKPVLQPKIIGSEKLQKPELRLSVPHLSQLQQPKKPIPVITPQGLIQTRIPSNISNLSNLNVQQPPYVFQRNQAATRDTFRPSIISHQYQNHMNGSSFRKTANGFYNGLIPQQVNQALPTPNIGKLNSTSDDDDWTDFISSPPVQPAKKHGANIPMANASRTNVINNSTVTIPNIIANPVHINYGMHPNKSNFGAYTRTVRKPSNSVNLGSQATTIPSISALPDLDFIAPKNKTFTKK
ncbi:hypothetical protein Trydic_g2095 [Trypoxylus dichotomus]